MLHRNRKLSAIAIALSTIALMAGCGGGGSSSPNTSPPIARFVDAAHLARSATRTAATNTPLAYSIRDEDGEELGTGVAQSSTGASMIAVEVTSDGVRQSIRYRVRNSGTGEEWDIDSERDNVIRSTFITSTGNDILRPLPDGGRLVIRVLVSSPDVAPDYRSAGVWTYLPPVGDSTDPVIGTYYYGTDPFAGNVAQLEGDATFTGGAGGVLSTAPGVVQAGETTVYFVANVELEAAFGGVGTPGTISGRITGFRNADGGMPIETGDGAPTELTLLSAEIDRSFMGDTRATIGGETYEGKWSGRLFGGNDGTPPGKIGGTFGAASGEGNRLIGIYGADRQ